MLTDKHSISPPELSAETQDVLRRKGLLSPEQLAEYLGVPLGTVYRWRARRTGPNGLRVGSPDGITDTTIAELRQVEPYIWCARIVTKVRRYDHMPWQPRLDHWFCRSIQFEPAAEDGVISSDVGDGARERLRQEGKLPG